jgi:hypothetical protein
VPLKEGDNPSLQRGNNHRNVRKGWGHFKIFFLRTIKAEKLDFTLKHSIMEQIILR